MTQNDPTAALIARLATAAPPAPLHPMRASLTAACGLLLGLGLLYQILGMRADLLAQLVQPVVAAKTLLPLTLGLLALSATFASTRPAARVRAWPLLLPLAVALGLFAQRAIAVPAEAFSREMAGQTIGACLISISALSILPLGLALWALRAGAATRPRRTGALAGLAVGAFAVTGYSLHCTEDSPLFYVAWYGAGMALSAAMGALLGGRLLRW